MSRSVPRIERNCLRCGKPFCTTRTLLDLGKGRFCSRPCAYEQQSLDATDPGHIAARFFENVNLDGPIPAHRPELGACHVWTGRLNGHGYGLLGVFGKDERAHRLAFFLAEGRWPEPCGLHHCDNPPCVRHSHLFEGTKADNSRDMAAKGRSGAQQHPERVARGERHGSRTHPERLARGDASGARKHPERIARGARSGAYTHPERLPRGEANGVSKLTESQVLEIRALRSQGLLLSGLAKRFGVTESLVSAIAHRKIWRHI